MEKRYSLLILAITVSVGVQAASCNKADIDKVDKFVQVAGQRIMDGKGGGTALTVSSEDCAFDPDKRTYQTKLKLSWKRAPRSLYEGDGVLAMKENGSGLTMWEFALKLCEEGGVACTETIYRRPILLTEDLRL